MERMMSIAARQRYLDAGVPMLFDDWTLYRGWRLQWHGWREGTNQMVRHGWWTANAPHEPRLPCVYRNTLGSWGFFEHDFNVLDVTRVDESRGPIGTDADKFDALRWLVAQIDHGAFRPSVAACARV